jgi:hypothetical protein
MGSRDALRNANLRIDAPSNDNPLPISAHARERHRWLSDIQQLKNFVVENPARLQELVRAAFEIEADETPDTTTMRMPPFMRQSNAWPLTLAAWQYDLLMHWVALQTAAPAAARAIAADEPTAAPLSDSAAQRRALVLGRLGGGSTQ